MIFYMLPLLFNPFALLSNYLPLFYLATWPIIIQTAGREALITHALLLILFVLTCDLTRQTSIKLIGFDLISLPIGIAMVAVLLSENGEQFLYYATPLFDGLLSIIEPLFLLAEVYLFMDMIQTFNKWLSERANLRDDDPHDISNWDSPLSRSSIMVRILVVILSVFCYAITYMVIERSKFLLGDQMNVPVNFNHAIAALVTLQIIALSANIYKDEGIVCEPAMVALLASLPIFLAAWSYNNLLKSAEQTSSSWSWSSYFPLSLFGWQQQPEVVEQPEVGLGLRAGGSRSGPAGGFDFGRAFSDDYDDSAGHLGRPTTPLGSQLLAGSADNLLGLQLDAASRRTLRSLVRKLIMLIDSALGLSLNKLAKYYFEPHFWYTLLARLACLFWLTSRWSLHQETQPGSSRPHRKWLGSLQPSGKALIKLLLVLAYAQMLVQQADNKQQLGAILEMQASPPTHEYFKTQVIHEDSGAARHSLTGWLECLWASASSCTFGPDAGPDVAATGSGEGCCARQSRFSRLFEWIYLHLTKLVKLMLALLTAVWVRAPSPGAFLWGLNTNWLLRWRSPIVQRLGQSAIVHLYYVGRLLVLAE